jgi:hypothetical protein
MLDYTTFLDKLVPERDGEDVLRLRTATVSAVNANGTLDVTMSDGTVVPGVPKMATAFAPVAAIVQVIAYRGSLLVIGAVGSSGANGAMTKTGEVTTGPPGPGATSFSTPVLFGVTFPAIPSMAVNMRTAPGTSAGWVFRAISVTTVGFTMFGSGASNTFSEPIQWTATYAP